MNLMAKTLFQLILRPQIFAVWACATAVASVAGPFGTFKSQPFLLGLLYWGVTIAVSILIGYGVRVVLWRLLPSLSAAKTELLATPFFAIIFGPVVLWLNSGWYGGVAQTGIGFWQLFGIALLVSGSVSVFALAFTGAWLSAHKATPVPAVAAKPVAQPGPPALLDRLPKNIRGEILALCAGDHHVLVFTDRGRADILMRLSDAIDLLGDLDGLRVHRSHWVSRAAVVGRKRANGRLFLMLKNDVEIPVSRSYRAAVDAQLTVPDLKA